MSKRAQALRSLGEGIGAVIEGGLLARAVESAHGKAAGTPRAPAPCFNCGALVTGQFCGDCGQNSHVHRTLAAIGHDIMHGVLHLDGKLWNTLPLLTLKPGELTRRCIAGERAKFVSPMALFLFSVFAMFAVFQIVGIGVPVDLPDGLNGKPEAAAIAKTIETEAATLRAKLDALPANDPQRRALERELAALDRIGKDASVKGSSSGLIECEGTGIKWLDDGIVTKWQKKIRA